MKYPAPIYASASNMKLNIENPLDSFIIFILYSNDLSKGLLKSKAQRRFLKVPASGNERA